jgi:hypothetical protein
MYIMKYFLSAFCLFFLIVSNANVLNAQTFKAANKFKFFNRTELNYGFGINQTFANERLNAFQIKTVFGKQNDRLGAGLGISTGTYKSTRSGGGGQFSTIAFSANFHYLIHDFYESRNNIFIKAGIGYAPKIFRGYDKGLNYDAALGYLIHTKKGGKYFVNVIYHHQDFENFIGIANTIKTNTIGLGIGTWF